MCERKRYLRGGICHLLSIFMVLSVPFFATVAYANGEISGLVLEREADRVKVRFSPEGESWPQVADVVLFFTEFDGISVEAGEGAVINVTDGELWVTIKDDRPEPGMTVKIYASGKAPQESVKTEVDHGWGAAAPPQSDENVKVNAVASAVRSCQFAYAKKLADDVAHHYPANQWLALNHNNIDLLARRAEVYQRAIGAAYQAFEQGDISSSLERLKEAMQYASVECQQDRQVQSLLQQARQIAELQRELAIEKARQNITHSARQSDAYRARIQAKRQSFEEVGSFLRGDLMGVLNSLGQGGNGAATLSPAGNEAKKDNTSISSESDSDNWIQQRVEQVERDNKEVLDKWRSSQQSWPATPGRE